MRRALLVLVALAAAGGCKKKSRALDPDDAAVPRAQVGDAAAPLPPPPRLPPSTPGPAYISINQVGVARLDPEGWKLIGNPTSGWAKYVRLVLGADGTLWAYNEADVWRFDGKGFVDRTAIEKITSAAGAPDATLWVIADGKLRHLVSGAWAIEAMPGGDPARGVAPDAEGIWVHTLDRTFRHTGAGWQQIDVHGVTGTQVDILSIASNGRDAYLATSAGVMAFDGTSWRAVPVPKDYQAGEWAFVVAGPAGRFALTTGYRVPYVGDTARGLRKLDVPDPTSATPVAVDDQGRTWVVTGANVAVFDEAGKLDKRWRPEDTPVLTNEVISAAIGGGGPAHLQAGERAAGTVTGKLEGSAAGVKVVTCAQATPDYGKEPCEGITTARSTTTIAGGTFTLTGVSIGPTNFWVQRNNRWRVAEGVACCTQLQPDGSVDVGTLTLR